MIALRPPRALWIPSNTIATRVDANYPSTVVVVSVHIKTSILELEHYSITIEFEL